MNKLKTNTVSQFAAAVEDHLAQGGMAIIATHIDLGLGEAEVLDLTPYRARGSQDDDPFLDEALQ